MKSEIKRWGHSAAIRLPKHLLEQAGTHIGGAVEITAQDGRIVIERCEEHHSEEYSQVIEQTVGLCQKAERELLAGGITLSEARAIVRANFDRCNKSNALVLDVAELTKR
jgi:antitoxin MazE|tara:strand:- start:1525 stop:1854 length:330 start_codon:yes stop_codon:yes gene_type:complete